MSVYVILCTGNVMIEIFLEPIQANLSAVVSDLAAHNHQSVTELVYLSVKKAINCCTMFLLTIRKTLTFSEFYEF